MFFRMGDFCRYVFLCMRFLYYLVGWFLVAPNVGVHFFPVCECVRRGVRVCLLYIVSVVVSAIGPNNEK